MTPFAEAFIERCRSAGLDDGRIKQAAARAAAKYGSAVAAEIAAGLNTGIPVIKQARGGALSLAQKLLSRGSSAVRPVAAAATRHFSPGGAALGYMSGSEMAGPSEAPYAPGLGNIGLALAGGFAGSARNRGTAAGRATSNMINRSGIGAGLGALGDAGAGLVGVDTGGRLGQLGAWGGGLGSLASGRAQLKALQSLQPSSRATQAVAGIGPFLDQAGQGMMSPFRWAGNQAKGFGRWASGHTNQTAPSWLRHSAGPAAAAPGMQSVGRTLGGASVAVPLGVAGAGAAYHGVTGQIDDAINQKYMEGLGGLDEYLKARGIIDPQTMQVQNPFGQFMNTVSPYLDPVLGMVGHNPQQMSHGQKALAGLGLLGAGYGGATGNWPMALGGIGLTAAPHFMQQPGAGARPMTGPGQVAWGQPAPRNEFTHQTGAPGRGMAL